MMKHPTKEEVEEFLVDADKWYCFACKDFTVNLAIAYLALKEELRIEQLSFLVSNERNIQIEREIYQLEAENQELRAKVDEYLRGGMEVRRDAKPH